MFFSKREKGKSDYHKVRHLQKKFIMYAPLIQNLESKTPEYTPNVTGNSTSLSCNDPNFT